MSEQRLYHILLWTGDGTELFPEKRKDRERFLKLLHKARTSGDLRVYAYCLLRDRLQFLCACPSGMIEKILTSVEGVYRSYCQSKYRDKAPVWERAVYECGWEGLLDLVRYVHRAPLRAEKRKGLAYRWSSHKAYLAGDDRWVDYRAVLNVYGKKESKAIKRYKRFIHGPSTDQPATGFYLMALEPQAPPVAASTAAEDAGAEAWELYESAVIVEDAEAKVPSEVAGHASDKPAVSGKDTGDEERQLTSDHVIAVTAELMGVTPASMKKRDGVAQEIAARRVALYILKEDLHLTNAETGRALGMAASTVSRWYNNEQWRDDLTSRIDRVRRQLGK